MSDTTLFDLAPLAPASARSKGMPVYTIAKHFSFSASHKIDGLPADHPCSRVHGHNYDVEVILQSHVLDATGFVRDFRELSALRDFIDATVDHRHLNDVLGHGRTTAEFIAQWPMNGARHVGLKSWPCVSRKRRRRGRSFGARREGSHERTCIVPTHACCGAELSGTRKGNKSQAGEIRPRSCQAYGRSSQRALRPLSRLHLRDRRAANSGQATDDAG